MSDDLPRIAYLTLLLVAMGGFLVVEFRARPGQTSRQAVAWALIFVGVAAGVGLWQDVQSRNQPRLAEGGRIEVPVGRDGHAHLTAEVNGTPIRFVVDTGASQIALSHRDAERAGLAPDALAYTQRAQTANGIVETAPVRLDSLTLGGVTDRDLPAVVIGGDLSQSLMGMSYLGRFARVSFEGSTLVLER